MEPQPGRYHRPVDLAREHGISPQTVRNHERDGFLPPADRTPSGHRRYTAVHAAALRAHLALVAAHGHAVAGEVMRAVHRGDVDAALTAIDRSHLQRDRDRDVLAAVEAAVPVLVGAPAAPGPDRPLPIGALAHRIGVVPATLRKWERAGVLVPGRDRGTRQYAAADVRDAQLAHLLRRGGVPLASIAVVIGQVRAAGGAEPLAASLDAWRGRLTDRGRRALVAAGLLAAYLDLVVPDIG